MPGTRRGPFTPGGILGRFFGSAISNAAGYSIGGAILPTLEPLTQDIANEAWQTHPVKPLSASAAAVANVRGAMTDAEATAEASRTGIDGARFAQLRQSMGDAPSSLQLLDLERRGLIEPATTRAGLAQNGILETWRDRMRALRFVLPSVTDMVRFAVREVYDPAAREQLDLDAEFPASFAADAALIGLDRERAGQYWAAHWDLPSYEQGVEMFHRGELTQAQLDGLLKALDYAPTWRSRLRAIAQRIPPLDDMIRFAVRDVYSPATRQSLGLDADYPAEFTAEAGLHGMDEDRARQYWAAHWRLPSALQGYRMLWRGEINEGELDELLKALDYPAIWRERLANIARLVPGRVDLRRMFATGILSRAETVAGYERLGYTPADAESLTQLAEADAGGGDAGGQWVNRAASRLYTVAHNEYLDGSLDGAGATEAFALLGIAPAERAGVLELWDAERNINRLELTPAQIKKAYKKALYTQDEAIAELVEREMSAEDAETYLLSG